MLRTLKRCTIHPYLLRYENTLKKMVGISSSTFAINVLNKGNTFRCFFVLSNNCLFNSTHRALTTPDNYHFPIEKSNEMNYFWEDYTKKLSFKRRCVNKVCVVLDCNEKSAVELVEEHPVLFLEDIDNTLENVSLLRENCILPNVIKDNMWLLYYDNGDLSFRIDSIRQWDMKDCTLHDLLPLLKLPPVDFERIIDVFMLEKESVPYGNRLVYLADLLKVSVAELTSSIVRHKYLLVRNLDLILDAIKSYKDFGISGKELVDDIWALRYTEPVIRRRLKMFKENGFSHLKAWYVRCSDENSEKMLEAYKMEKSIIHPFTTREEFLASKLEIELPVIQQVVKRNPIFHKINITKLTEMIDYLKKTGFKGSEICSCCRIFHFSLETTIERINELRDLRVEAMSISMLIKNQTDYRKLINRIEYINNFQEKNLNNKT